jgi:hypothetical protein
VEQAARFRDKRIPCTKLLSRWAWHNGFLLRRVAEKCCVFAVEIRKERVVSRGHELWKLPVITASFFCGCSNKQDYCCGWLA